MLDEEKRNNFNLRVSIDNLKSLIDLLEKGEMPDSESIKNYRSDLVLLVDSITNYHARFTEVMETIKHIKDLELPTSM
ncbi:MAG: hypothetical protein JJT78_11475 [Leptospira sp.]|nr:hypothetical protein [Leptospira sp.]